jgi:hypothetical protein
MENPTPETPDHNTRVAKLDVLTNMDILRCSILMVLTFFMIGITDFAPREVPTWYRLLSTSWCLATGVISAIGIAQITAVNFTKLKSARKLLWPKLLINFSALLLLLLVCMWVFFLGGVLRSPLGSLLAISPIFFIVEYFRNRDQPMYVEALKAWLRQKYPDYQNHDTLFDSQLNWARRLGVASFSVVVLNLIIGELLVRTWNLHHLFFSDPRSLKIIYNSNWFTCSSYIVYYSSIISTAIAIRPQEDRQKLLTNLVS